MTSETRRHAMCPSCGGDMWASSARCKRCAGRLFARRTWMADAECRGMDPDMFLPNKGDVRGERQAKAVCNECPVAALCLAYALAENLTVGIFGGTSARQRRAMRKAHQ